MRFSIATILVIVPLLASASPLVGQPRATIPLYKRSNLYQPDGSFNVEKLRGHLDYSMAKIMHGLDNYERNTGKRHPLQPKVVSTVSRRTVGNVPLTDEDKDKDKELWYGAISVGTPPKLFTVEYDTGSSDLFLSDSTCGSGCSGHTLYNSSASSTSKALEKPFHLWYRGRSNVSGNLYKDTVNIAGLNATSQTLGSATRYDPEFRSYNFPADGVVGMGFQSISEYNASPVFQSLVSQGQTTSGVFAFKLASPGSELSIGGLNTALYSGTPTYTPVTHKGLWQIEFSALKVGNTKVVKSTPAIVDSGCTFIIGSTSGVKAFYAEIRDSKHIGTGLYTFPCSATIPAISFTIGGKALPMPASALKARPAWTEPGRCVGSIVAADIGSDFWILGNSWMRNFYTIFDSDNSRVGFADLK